MLFNEKLRNRRLERDLTQEELAAKLNYKVTRQAVSKWENVTCAYPQVEQLLELSVALDISLDDLFADELKYLRGDSTILAKYPGIEAGLRTFIDRLKNAKK